MTRSAGGRLFRLIAVLTSLPLGAAQAAVPALEPVVLFTTTDWKKDDHRAALDSFLAACASRSHPRALAFRVADGMRRVDAADWQRTCAAGRKASGGAAKARAFFEQEFTPYRLGAPGAGMKVTGYYLPVLKASRQRSAQYPHAIYGLPAELANDPKDLFFTRSAIDAGALDGRKLELLWTGDPVMRFFLQVQGSGFATLPDGKKVQLLYAGKNNQPYVAIGRQLAAEGEIAKDKLSMQTIRDWLRAHPSRQVELMQTNPSYVFFKLNEHPRPVTGASGTALVAGRSLAIDPAYYPYRMPVFLRFNEGGKAAARTLIAADTGSAIVGPNRADVYYGEGASAEKIAGELKASADTVLLLPRAPRRGE